MTDDHGIDLATSRSQFQNKNQSSLLSNRPVEKKSSSFVDSIPNQKRKMSSSNSLSGIQLSQNDAFNAEVMYGAPLPKNSLKGGSLFDSSKEGKNTKSFSSLEVIRASGSKNVKGASQGGQGRRYRERTPVLYFTEPSKLPKIKNNLPKKELNIFETT